MRKALGIDIGGTKINAGLIDENGVLLSKKSISTNAFEGRDVILPRLTKLIKEFDSDIVGIGIASPGFINNKEGIVEWAGNIEGWSELNLRNYFTEIFPDRIIEVHNDANMAGVCEGWIGAAKNFESFVMITLGTGLGGAIFHKDMGLWVGKNFQGAELGHVILHPGGRKCNCGQFGCSEKYIAGSALGLNYKALTGKKRTSPQIIKLLDEDQNAKKALNRFTNDLAIFLTNITNFLDPEAIIIGGGFIYAKEHWWQDTIDRYRINCNRSERTKILPALHLNDSGMIGSAKMVFDSVEGK